MWTRRTKRASVTALALVAIIAGVAVAFFLKTQEFDNNTATGGQLTVDSTLPVTFTDPLYPTFGPDNGSLQTFDITNNNTVPVDYQLFATCKTSCPAGSDQENQWQNLWVQIDNTNAPACAAPYSTIDGTVPQNSTTQPALGCPSDIYYGKLSDLTATHTAKLTQGDAACNKAPGPGTATEGSTPLCAIAAGDTRTYDVHLWLQNVDNPQPQGVTSNWEFFLSAKTPQS